MEQKGCFNVAHVGGTAFQTVAGIATTCSGGIGPDCIIVTGEIFAAICNTTTLVFIHDSA